MDSLIIKAQELTKIYKLKQFFKREKVIALDRLNLEVRKGKIFGFLGPNGAGKTTTIKILLGLTPPTAGEVYIFNKEPGDVRVKKNIGYLPEMTYYENYLKIDEILKYYGQLYGLSGSELNKKIDEVLELVGLNLFRKRFLKEYSKGMLQRVGLAQALINNPDLLILDEPTSGLDPIAQMEIRNIIQNLAGEGKTIFLSSHFLSEVELICTNAGILKNGKLIKFGPMSDLLQINQFFEIHITKNEKFHQALKDRDISVIPEQDTLIVSTEDEQTKQEVINLAAENKVNIIAVYPRKDSLETLFKKLMQGNKNADSN